MTAPTEAEIRAAIAETLPADHTIDDIGLWVAVIGDSDLARTRGKWDKDVNMDDDHPGTLWADMTGEEGEELQRLIYDAMHRAQRAFIAELIENVTAATLAFAAAHPDIPRGTFRAAQPVPA